MRSSPWAALLLYGLAIALSDVYSKWLGWAAVTVGIGWIVLGLVVAHNGFFSQATLPMLLSALLALWVLVLAVFLWRIAKRHIH